MTFEELKSELEKHPAINEVRRGYSLKNGWISDEESVVVSVKSEFPFTEIDEQSITDLQSEVGIPVEVEYTSPEDLFELEESSPLSTEFFSLLNKNATNRKSRYGNITYEPPRGENLNPTEDASEIICSVSPDSGWDLLLAFLRDAKGEVTIGMYDFTAPHILDEIEKGFNENITSLNLVIQEKAHIGSGTKKDDLPEHEVIQRLKEKYKDKFNFEYAHVTGKTRIFGGYYHIKVATDGKKFWLSSGNWQSSNVPKHFPAKYNSQSPWYISTYNREWQVIVKSEELAKKFEKYLKHDLEESRIKNRIPKHKSLESFSFRPEIFVPIGLLTPYMEEKVLEKATYYDPLKLEFSNSNKVKIHPLLTPDNFIQEIKSLLETANTSISFQNQALSINKTNEEEFMELLQVMVDKQNHGVDVRIILRGEFIGRGKLERLKAKGFNMNKIRLQDRCHTKGIIIDSKICVVGSHNFSNSGTTINRDASLVFYSSEISDYYENIFNYDWEYLTHQKVRLGDRKSTPRIASPLESTPPGMVRMSWDEFYGEL